ncbi:hypothetical protein GCM10009745_80290 [Kribbella yunnanensis]|uniref:Uncharacterized protein n=1 Tax=Kribbella yunnanensis TaxID=190194 RepID=A0ABP4VAA3_9ACTN
MPLICLLAARALPLDASVEQDLSLQTVSAPNENYTPSEPEELVSDPNLLKASIRGSIGSTSTWLTPRSATSDLLSAGARF